MNNTVSSTAHEKDQNQIRIRVSCVWLFSNKLNCIVTHTVVNTYYLWCLSQSVCELNCVFGCLCDI